MPDPHLTEEQRLMRGSCRAFVDDVVLPFIRREWQREWDLRPEARLLLAREVDHRAKNALAVVQAAQIRLAKPKAAAPAGDGGGATRRVALFMGAVALATALLKPLGYAPVAFLLMLALLRVLGVRWQAAGLIALISAAASPRASSNVRRTDASTAPSRRR